MIHAEVKSRLSLTENRDFIVLDDEELVGSLSDDERDVYAYLHSVWCKRHNGVGKQELY